jgi:hypothetical protein
MFQLCLIEGMNMPTNIPEASANPIDSTTQHAPAVTIASFISIASRIPMD